MTRNRPRRVDRPGTTGGYIGLGAESGLRPDGCFEGAHGVVRPPGYPKPLVLTVRILTPVACVEDVEDAAAIQLLAPSEEREEPMSSTPISDEGPEVDDETLSEVVRRPTRTAAICPRWPTRHRGSPRRTLLVILKRSPRSRELKPRASCSRTYSAECGESRSISDSSSPDHRGISATTP